ncbi:DUF7351 domain-containing protein [Haladaptatus sp. ZSTT2]|uniref:DUF7351 domain-containing protein n=1 Tax=Haladaptatus sp. ZSTT2 TaxID=3120515 RepID=UPI00300E8429
MSEEGLTVETQPAEAVFALLSNDTRIEILRVLAAADGPLPFSELYDRVGLRDSGQFNYHLQKLAGTFIKQGDEGYELTIAGMQVVGALIAGTYTATATLDPIELDDPCPKCGTRSVVVTYNDEHAHVTCTACDEFHNQYSFPPGTLSQYDRAELPAAFDRWIRVLFYHITAGFCVNCAGRLSGSLDAANDPPRFEWRCERCGDIAIAEVSSPVFFHPALQGFLYDRGIGPKETPTWRLFGSDELEITTDDSGVTIAITIDAETLTATIDTTGMVTSVSRTDR